MVRQQLPEQFHYETIEKFMQTSIRSGAAFLFDKTLFDIELHRLWITYDVPYPVSTETRQAHALRHLVCD